MKSFLLFGLLLTSASDEPTKAQRDLIRWTTHYSQKMGVDPDGIVFGSLPGNWCGATFASKTFTGTYVAFDTNKLRCKLWSRREQALHEMCHVKLDHADPRVIRDHHPDVSACMKEFR